MALQYTPGTRGITKLEAFERSLALDPLNAEHRANVEELRAYQRGENSN